MQMLPPGLKRETEIAEAAAEVERLLAPDVVSIRYKITTDWSDEWAVYFRAVLSYEAAEKRLLDTASKVEERLADRLDFEELGLNAYHHYRSASEQAVLRDETWK